MQELNDKIKKRIAPDHPRRRLLRYALDETILSTADYDRFPAWIDKQGNPLDALTSVPWLTELFWIRAFYEKADGYNVWTIFKNQFGQNVQESLSYIALRQFAQNLPSPFGSPDEFLRECWLVGGGNPNANDHITGMDSRVWKFLAPMVRKCPSADSVDDLAGFCQDFLDQRLKIPPHFEWLIQNEDTDFLKSLSVLHRQDGVGWLERVALLPKNILDCAGFDAGWMLYLNGNMRRIDLVVNNIYLPVGHAGNVSVRQGGRALVSQPAHGDSLFFWSDDLLAEGLNPEESVHVHLNGSKETIDPLDLTAPILFRYSLNSRGSWLRMIPRGEHPYARRVAVWTPHSFINSRFTFGGDPVASEGSVPLRIGSFDGSLHTVGLNDLSNNEPRELRLGDQSLAWIGCKPWIEIPGADASVQSLDFPEAIVIFGDSANVSVKNLPNGGGDVEWRCAGGILVENEQTANITQVPMGQPITVKCCGARSRLLFIPGGIFDTPPEGWCWTPSNDENERISFARDGVEVGMVSGPNDVCLRIKRPLKTLTWWWQKGVFGNPEKLNKKEEFNDHGELSSYRLCMWVPNDVQMSFIQQGTIQPFVRDLGERKGPCAYAEIVGSLLRNHLRITRIGNAVDTLKIGNCEVADIFRVPNSPVLCPQEQPPRVFFPQNNYDPSAYSVVCCYESGIKDDRIEIVPCAGMRCGQLNDVPVQHQRVNDEGIWLLLVRSNTLSTSLMQFPLSTHVEGAALEWFKPEGSALVQRLGVEGGTEEANQLRGLLDALAWTGNVLRRQGVFADVINGRHLLSYTNRTAFWNRYFADHCQIEAEKPPCPPGRRHRNASLLETNPTPLEETLSLMLDAGFNWCAEPNWLAWAFDQIPLAMGWKKLGKSRREELREKLKEICPLMLVQQAIECGYPACDQNQCPDFGYINYFLAELPSGMLRLMCPESGYVEWVNGHRVTRPNNKSPFTAQGVSLNGQYRQVNINYHASNIVRFARNEEWFRCVLHDEKEQTFRSYMLDAEAIGDEPILDDAAYEKLNTVFGKAIDAAAEVLGKKEDRGLGYMFALASEGFREWDQPGRAVVFQAAVLCRLHAWLGWRAQPNDPAPPYPDDWPLHDADAYGLVCSVLRSAWQDEALRKVFLKDMIPVEWMLAWFHF